MRKSPDPRRRCSRRLLPRESGGLRRRRRDARNGRGAEVSADPELAIGFGAEEKREIQALCCPSSDFAARCSERVQVLLSWIGALCIVALVVEWRFPVGAGSGSERQLEGRLWGDGGHDMASPMHEVPRCLLLSL